MKQNDTNKIVLGSLLIAMGAVLPIVFHTAGLGRVFLPMHLPVMLAGVLLGKKYGALVGFVTPYVSSFMTGMPPLFPTGFVMSFELATYAFVIGFLFEVFTKKTKITPTLSVYIALILSMLFGRLVYGVINAIVLGFTGDSYTFSMFLTTMFVEAVPGILLQLLLVPPIIFLVQDKIQTKQN